MMKFTTLVVVKNCPLDCLNLSLFVSSKNNPRISSFEVKLFLKEYFSNSSVMK